MMTFMAKKRGRSLARLSFGRVPDDQLQLAYRIRVGIFFLLVFIIVVAPFLVYQLAHVIRGLVAIATIAALLSIMTKILYNSRNLAVLVPA
jgi:hypothetical protein